MNSIDWKLRIGGSRLDCFVVLVWSVKNKWVCGRKAGDEFIYVQWKRNLSKRQGKQAGRRQEGREPKKTKYESIN